MMPKVVSRALSAQEAAARDMILALLEEIGDEVSVYEFLLGMVAAMIGICDSASVQGEAGENRRKLADMLLINSPGTLDGLSPGRPN